ncbi:oxidoreductase [Aeromicrobium sp. CTD01-1L150]|uniref:oxidoreductase n=1 Tax=Aeromicrobium sp. CTD01-1L150 TaxID=3341830 RepID=UPI0035C15370
MTTWLITGCSSGLGRSLAEAVLARGDNAVVTARDVTKIHEIAEAFPDTAELMELDVTNEQQVQSAVETGGGRFGGVDILVNNAGFGYRSAVEEGEDDIVRRLFETHFHGPVHLVRAVLPEMRERRSGTIVNISSISARTSPAGSGFYAAAKSALEALSLSLLKEVKPLGISVMVVEPGPFRTEFTGRSLEHSRDPIEDYAETAGGRREENSAVHGTQSGDPDRAALAIMRVLEAERLPFVLPLGEEALNRLLAMTDRLRSDSAAWRDVIASTDYPRSDA